MFLTQLLSISEYCRILNTPHHLCLIEIDLNTLPSSSSRECGELGGGLTSGLVEGLVLSKSGTVYQARSLSCMLEVLTSQSLDSSIEF